MPDLIRGQRLKVSDLTPALQLELGVRVAGPAYEYDVSVFGLDPAGKLSDDRYMIFYNQKRSPEGAVQMLGPSGGEQRFAVDLSAMPRSVERLMVTASVADSSFSQISSGHLSLYAGGRELARFPFHGADFGQEKAIIIGELYLKDVWRFSAVGQGFAGGLDALVKAYGGEVSAPAPGAAAPPPAPPSRLTNARPAPINPTRPGYSAQPTPTPPTPKQDSPP